MSSAAANSAGWQHYSQPPLGAFLFSRDILGGHGRGGGCTSWPNFRPHTNFRVNFNGTGKESIAVATLFFKLQKNKNKSLKTGVYEMHWKEKNKENNLTKKHKNQ
jgi:hypothetical protein